MHFIEIYYSSFTRNTVYEGPFPIDELPAVLKRTTEAPMLATRAIVVFDWKKGPRQAYINFKRLEMERNWPQIMDLMARYQVKVKEAVLF